MRYCGTLDPESEGCKVRWGEVENEVGWGRAKKVWGKTGIKTFARKIQTKKVGVELPATVTMCDPRGGGGERESSMRTR